MRQRPLRKSGNSTRDSTKKTSGTWLHHYPNRKTVRSISAIGCQYHADSQEQGRYQQDSPSPEIGGVKTTTKYEATERLVNSFSAIPTEWVKIVAQQTGSEFYGIMWGTMFLVNDPVDKRRIKALVKPVDDPEDELYGSQDVGDTGISVFEIDGEVVLGVNGAGYDFYEHHWIPLYEALGYAWHETG